MIDGEKIVAVIPARQNSKGLPGKNIADLCGKPLVAWSIEAALHSELIDNVLVSTDGEAIRNVARAYGASVPFIRPAELAADDTPGVAPIIHACKQLPGYDIVVVLQPTSPLRTPRDIDNAIKLLRSNAADFCVSVTSPKHHPNWLFKTGAAGKLERYEDKPLALNRQELQEAVALNGAVYVARIQQLFEEKTLLGRNTVSYLMEPQRSFDIDTAWDLKLCQLIISDRLWNSIK